MLSGPADVVAGRSIPSVTLIISVLTERYAALVSDRRVTWSTRGRVTRQEDTDTKTFMLFGQFIMGFTGVARIDQWRIERWAMDIFRGVPTDQYFNVLAQEINGAFDRLGLSGKEPHAFLAAGYANLQPDGRVQPLSVTVSNCLDDRGRVSPSAVRDKFRIHVEPLGNRRQLIKSVGWPMNDTTRRALAHRVRVVVKGDPSNPALSAGPLVMALRDTARRSKGYVGNAALFASLPRAAVPAYGVAMGQIDYRENAASIFIPEDGRRLDEGAIYFPAIFNPGMSIAGAKMYPGIRPPDLLKKQDGFK